MAHLPFKFKKKKSLEVNNSQWVGGFKHRPWVPRPQPGT
jgi:hypothetical protein